jgi:hypothetical protein
MKKYLLLFFIIASFFSFSFTQKKDLVFKGGHSVQLRDTLYFSTDSSGYFTEMLTGWSPYLNKILFSSYLYKTKENVQGSGVKFTDYAGGVNFIGGKYLVDSCDFCLMDEKLLFTENYNNYKAQINLSFGEPGVFYLVNSTKGLNDKSDYYEDFTYWVIVVNKRYTEIAESKKITVELPTSEMPANSEIKNQDDSLNTVIKNKAKTENNSKVSNIKLFPRLSANSGVLFETRYYWRGQDVAKAPVFEPYVTVSYDDLKLSIKAVYALSAKIFINNNYIEYNKIEAGLNYSYKMQYGNLSVGLKDYFYPYLGLKYFNFDDKGKGAHTPQAEILFAGMEEFPIHFFGSIGFYNDPDRSLYLELGYLLKLQSCSIDFFAGGTKGPTKLYNARKYALINLGFSVEKQYRLTENITIPLAVTYYLNVNSEENAVVFKIGF